MGPRPHLWICALKITTLASELLVSMGPSPHLLFLNAKFVFWMQNSEFRTRITLLYGSQPSSLVLCIQNSDFITRISGLYGYQPSSMVLFIQNTEMSTRITSLYGSQTSPVVLCMQNSVIGTRKYKVPDLTCRFVHAKQRDWHQKILVSMGPRSHLSLCACKTAWLAPENTSLYGSQTHLSFCACKTARLAPELLISMGPSPHLRFCAF